MRRGIDGRRATNAMKWSGGWLAGEKQRLGACMHACMRSMPVGLHAPRTPTGQHFTHRVEREEFGWFDPIAAGLIIESEFYSFLLLFAFPAAC